MLAIFQYVNGEPRAEVFCNGCGQIGTIAKADLPALFQSTVVRGIAYGLGKIEMRLPGLYFGPCCEAAAGKAIRNRNAAIVARELRRGRK